MNRHGSNRTRSGDGAALAAAIGLAAALGAPAATAETATPPQLLAPAAAPALAPALAAAATPPSAATPQPSAPTTPIPTATPSASAATSSAASSSAASSSAPAAAPQLAALFQPNMTSGSAAFAYAAPRPSASAPAGSAAIAGVPSDPMAAAIERALSGRVARQAPGLAESYADHGHRPVWVAVDASGAPTDLSRAEALVDAFGMADAHALPATRYAQDALRERLAGASAASVEALAALDVDLSRAYLTFAQDIHGGALDPRAISRNMDVERPQARVDALLVAARGDQDPAELFARLAPQSADYARLKELWADLRAVEAAGGWGAPLGGRTLREGERGVEVERLRARLAALGDLDPAIPAARDAATGEALFGPTLAAAVRAMQTRHGLKADAVVGRNTYAALNKSAAERAAQIAVNMEQARWRNRPLGLRHILVNIPDFHVDIVENGRIAFRSAVVVGTRRHQTPEFSDEMTHMVVNPKWNVPNSIATEELLPELVADPYSLSARDIHVYASSGGRVDPTSVHWPQFGSDYFPFRMVQEPGPRNALGDVKFMFPNRHAVYLHDTPAKSLFGEHVRAFSHGCVRVAKPVELAKALLSRQQSDPLARFQSLRARRGEQYEDLQTAVPVHIVYRTAWVDTDGRLQLRNDIYGRDRRVADALRREGLVL